jgi:hypothetical protein
MKDNAVLTERTASKVIRDAGYKVVSFKRGEPPTVTAWLFHVNRFETIERASLEDSLREDLKDADRIAVDSLGRATVVVSRQAAVSREALSASLRKRGVEAEDFETKSWPKLEATYLVAVPG